MEATLCCSCGQLNLEFLLRVVLLKANQLFSSSAGKLHKSDCDECTPGRIKICPVWEKRSLVLDTREHRICDAG